MKKIVFFLFYISSIFVSLSEAQSWKFNFSLEGTNEGNNYITPNVIFLDPLIVNFSSLFLSASLSVPQNSDFDLYAVLYGAYHTCSFKTLPVTSTTPSTINFSGLVSPCCLMKVITTNKSNNNASLLTQMTNQNNSIVDVSEVISLVSYQLTSEEKKYNVIPSFDGYTYHQFNIQGQKYYDVKIHIKAEKEMPFSYFTVSSRTCPIAAMDGFSWGEISVSSKEHTIDMRGVAAGSYYLLLQESNSNSDNSQSYSIYVTYGIHGNKDAIIIGVCIAVAVCVVGSFLVFCIRQKRLYKIYRKTKEQLRINDNSYVEIPDMK